MDGLLNRARAPKHRVSRKIARLVMPADTKKPAASLESLHWAQSAHEHMVTTRHARIATAAYLKAEARGFQLGYEAQDWITAQLEIDAQESFSYKQW